MAVYVTRSAFWGLVAFVVLVTVGFLAGFIVLGVKDIQNIKTINLVGPNGGEVTLEEGLGIVITPKALDHEVQINTTAILTLNGFGPGPLDGDFIVDVVTPGLSLASWAGNLLFANEGVLSIIAGPGIARDQATGDVTISNTGVLSILPGDHIGVSNPTGNVTIDNNGVTIIVASTGISVNASTKIVQITNTGVTSLNSFTGALTVAASNGLTATSAANTVTITDNLVSQTALADTDPLGPAVNYQYFIGSVTPVPINTWRTGLVVGFPSPFTPGSFDGGQGDVSGIFWDVPAVGMYTANVDCTVTPSTVTADVAFSAQIALSLGASSENPATGWQPFGGTATIDMAGGTTPATPPVLPRRISASTTFQAGCTGCIAQVGHRLTGHARIDNGAGTETAVFFCRLQVTRTK
jgi:hypothetical protein